MKPHIATTIRIRLDNLALVRLGAGLTTTADLAAAMGMHPTTVGRTLKGQAQLGAPFIGALLGAFPGIAFEQLFAVETSDHAAPAPVPDRLAG